MAKKGQKFNEYTTQEKQKIVNSIVKGKKSYREISEEKNIPMGTLAGWVRQYRLNGNMKSKKRGRPKKEKSDKERIKELELENEILKKFQTFLNRQ